MREVRGVRLWLAASVLSSALGCVSAGTGTGTGTGELPVLRVGTSGDYAPFSKGGEGFDIALARAMARDLGYRIEWVPFTWPELQPMVERNAFDVGMSGITWKPHRAVAGWMTRAVAAGGPCMLIARQGEGTLAVNRGGILERWARSRFPAERIVTVDDNLSLPELLARGEVDAIVTDRFEVEHFARAGWERRCEPARDRKVYWVSPARAGDLGPSIDTWLGTHEARVRELRGQWLGATSDWTPVQHLVDLLARRLALMPAVAAYKRQHGLPIEDLEREEVVLEQVLNAAHERGLERDSVRALFVAQIELAKAVQRRTTGAEPMDLHAVLRPALSRLGPRILDALAACAPELPGLQLEQLDLLVPWLEPSERERLLEALRSVRAQQVGQSGGAAAARLLRQRRPSSPAQSK